MVKDNPGILILSIILIFSINLALGNIQDRLLTDLTLQSIIFTIAAYLFQMGLNLGLVRICLNILYGREASAQQLFGSFHILIFYAAGSILFLLIVLVGALPGIILLMMTVAGDVDALMDPGTFSGMFIVFPVALIIIPAVYISIRLQYYDYFLVDEECGPIEALLKSMVCTKGYVMELFLLGTTVSIIILISIVPLGLGLFLSIPLATMVNTYVYNLLKTAT